MPSTDGLVVGVEKEAEVWVEDAVSGDKRGEDKLFEEPCGVGAMPLGRAGVGHGLDALILGRQRGGQGLGMCSDGRVAGRQGRGRRCDVVHASPLPFGRRTDYGIGTLGKEVSHDCR